MKGVVNLLLGESVFVGDSSGLAILKSQFKSMSASKFTSSAHREPVNKYVLV